ncbi:uncharacterized protein LOC119080648 [Bradysia coprophila]|uniref:uncharacterized protein LOC119080648 n=1 Tax=Bradysia coprophila TaxID=38358 RepID=UPI00187DBB66|nr:uncharacterized protein LOC119080648 [Bradysia coprophila]
MISKSLLFVFLLSAPLLVTAQMCEHMDITPHPQWCSAFFVCRFGFWAVFVCPGGLMYNPVIFRCDFPENVDCVNDPELTTPEWTSPTFSTPSVPTRTIPTRTIPTRTTPTSYTDLDYSNHTNPYNQVLKN